MNYWIKTVSACANCHSITCCCDPEKQVSLRAVIRLVTSCPEEYRFPDADTDPADLKAFTDDYKAKLDAELDTFGDRIINTHSILRLVTASRRGNRKPRFASRELLTAWIEEEKGYSRYIVNRPQDEHSRVAHVSLEVIVKAGVRIRDASTLEREANSWAACPNIEMDGINPYALTAWCDMQLLALGYQI